MRDPSTTRKGSESSAVVSNESVTSRTAWPTFKLEHRSWLHLNVLNSWQWPSSTSSPPPLRQFTDRISSYTLTFMLLAAEVVLASYLLYFQANMCYRWLLSVSSSPHFLIQSGRSYFAFCPNPTSSPRLPMGWKSLSCLLLMPLPNLWH